MYTFVPQRLNFSVQNTFFSIASDRFHHDTLNSICFVKFGRLCQSTLERTRRIPIVVPATNREHGFIIVKETRCQTVYLR